VSSLTHRPSPPTLGNKVNDLHDMTRSDIAEPCCHWAEDKEATRHPMLVTRKVMSHAFYCLMIFICLAGLFHGIVPSISHYDIFMKSAMACFGIVNGRTAVCALKCSE